MKKYIMLIAFVTLSSATIYAMEEQGGRHSEQVTTNAKLEKGFPIPQEVGFFYQCGCKQLMNKLSWHTPYMAAVYTTAYLAVYIYVLGHTAFGHGGDSLQTSI